MDCSNPSSVAKYNEKPLDTSIEYINRKRNQCNEKERNGYRKRAKSLWKSYNAESAYLNQGLSYKMCNTFLIFSLYGVFEEPNIL